MKLGCARVSEFLLKETGSLGDTESEVWIDNFKVKVRKTTEHKLHKISALTKILQNFSKTSTPGLLFNRIKIYWVLFSTFLDSMQT